MLSAEQSSDYLDLFFSNPVCCVVYAVSVYTSCEGLKNVKVISVVS